MPASLSQVQARAVAREYAEAKDDGNEQLARAIYFANGPVNVWYPFVKEYSRER